MTESGGWARYAWRLPGDVAEWLRSGLQSRLHRFDSGRRLHKNPANAGTSGLRNRAPLTNSKRVPSVSPNPHTLRFAFVNRASARWLLTFVAVAQTPGGLTGAFLRVGTKRPKVVARPRRAVLGLGAAGLLSDRHSERGPGFRGPLCATATCESNTHQPPRPDFSSSSWMSRKGRRPRWWRRLWR
jgi:hypothetical protein